MKKKIILISLFILIIGIAFSVFNYYQRPSSIKEQQEEQKKIEVKDNENKIEVTEDKETKVIEEKSKENENIKSDNKSSDNVPATSNKTSKDVSKNNNKNIVNNNTQNNSSIESNNNPTTITQKEEPKQKTPWEELGLTENQYKNQPMYSWEEVDFKTKDECMNYGNEHAEYGFECSEVTSWTRSLGWDYKTF